MTLWKFKSCSWVASLSSILFFFCLLATSSPRTCILSLCMLFLRICCACLLCASVEVCVVSVLKFSPLFVPFSLLFVTFLSTLCYLSLYSLLPFSQLPALCSLLSAVCCLLFSPSLSSTFQALWSTNEGP